MVEFLSQILNGLTIGNVYALIGLGFTLIFGVARLINFAQGSLFMIGAYLAYSGIAIFGLPILGAFAIAILLTTGLGLVVERVGVRPLESGPVIAPFLSTLVIAIILDELARVLWGYNPRPFPDPFSGTVWYVGDAFITGVDVAIFVVAGLSMVGLVLFLAKTWNGRAMRAAAQDPDAALQMGIEVRSMRTMAFAIASALGALAGVLVGMYYTSIFPTMGLPYAIKGFAAALVGGFTSIPGAILGGYLLGVFESLASGYVGQGLRDVIAYGLLLLVLLVRPQGILGSQRLDALGGVGGTAGAVPGTSPLATLAGTSVPTARRLPFRPWMVLVLVIVVALLPRLLPNPYLLQVVTLIFVYAILAIGLTIVSGTAGQISIAQGALFGVGAYAAAGLAKTYGLPAEIVLPGAGVAAAVFAVVAALPALKLAGHAVALASLAVGIMTYLVILNWIEVTRGPFGIPGIPAPRFALTGDTVLFALEQKYWLALTLLVLSFLASRRLLASPIGRAWRAIREDRPAAHAAGIPVGRYLAMAHGSAGFFAGVAGAMFAYLSSFVSPESFSLNTSILVLTMVILGGMGNLGGAVLGAGVMIGLAEVLRFSIDYRIVMLSLILLIVLRFRPQGILGID